MCVESVSAHEEKAVARGWSGKNFDWCVWACGNSHEIGLGRSKMIDVESFDRLETAQVELWVERGWSDWSVGGSFGYIVFQGFRLVQSSTRNNSWNKEI